VHEAALRVLELLVAEQREAELAADGVRARVLDRREGVNKPVLALRPGRFECLPGLRLQVAVVPLGDLLGTLRAAEVLGHGRIPEQLL
jgi:hypothetical protein